MLSIYIFNILIYNIHDDKIESNKISHVLEGDVQVGAIEHVITSFILNIIQFKLMVFYKVCDDAIHYIMKPRDMEKPQLTNIWGHQIYILNHDQTLDFEHHF